MNLFIKILILLCFVIVISPNILSQDCKAHLIIESDIVNVNIFINDTLVGSGMSVDVYLKEGTHKIVVLEESDRWDAKTFIDTVVIEDCNDVKLKYIFTSKVLLNSDPEDAYVFSNDSLVGYTPLLLPIGLNNVRLEKPGFESNIVDYSDFNRHKS